MLLNTIVFALHRWIEIRSVHFLNGDLWFLVFVREVSCKYFRGRIDFNKFFTENLYKLEGTTIIFFTDAVSETSNIYYIY